MKQFLFIFQGPQCQGARGIESLEQLMIVAAFEQQVTALFVDDAVFQLKRDQQSSVQATKSIGQMLEALPLYEVNTIYVEQESLLERGIVKDDLVLPVQTIARAEMSSLLSRYQQVVNC